MNFPGKPATLCQPIGPRGGDIWDRSWRGLSLQVETGLRRWEPVRLLGSLVTLLPSRPGFRPELTFWRFYFFNAVLGLQKNWEESTNFPYSLCPHTFITSLIINIAHHRVHLLQSVNLSWHVIITQSIHSLHQGLSWCWHSVGLDKCVMTCTHRDSIVQSSFTVPGYFPGCYLELVTHDTSTDILFHAKES